MREPKKHKGIQEPVDFGTKDEDFEMPFEIPEENGKDDGNGDDFFKIAGNDQEDVESGFVDIKDGEDAEGTQETSSKFKAKINLMLGPLGKKIKRNFKQKNNTGSKEEWVEIQDKTSSGDFVILGETGQKKRMVKTVLKYSALTALFLVVIAITYLLMSYRFVPEKLVGSEANILGLSMISRDYQIPVDELRSGDIIVKVENFDASPLVFKYSLYRFQSSKGEIFVVTSLKNGLQATVEQRNISYVVDGVPRMYSADSQVLQPHN